MPRIEFTIPGVPVAQPRQRHRVVTSGGRSFAQNYTPARDPVNAFKAACVMAAEQVWSGPPITGPVQMDLLFVMPRPAKYQWKKRPGPRLPHTGKPDRDNLAKAVQDALEGMVYANDSQVYAGQIGKCIASMEEHPHTEVCIEWDN